MNTKIIKIIYKERITFKKTALAATVLAGKADE